MQVKILEERGYDNALRGMSYSFKDRATDTESWWEAQRPRAMKRAELLAPKGEGHNKFLRQIELWVDVEAARCWWSEFDTYQVGTTRQSESTMHTLSKRPPVMEDFEIDTSRLMVEAFMISWEKNKGNIAKLKCDLPEGFLQRRMVTLNYMNLRNIIQQRTNHRLHYWDWFIKALLEQVEHPELLK